jgi:hypothetical protein
MILDVSGSESVNHRCEKSNRLWNITFFIACCRYHVRWVNLMELLQSSRVRYFSASSAPSCSISLTLLLSTHDIDVMSVHWPVGFSVLRQFGGPYQGLRKTSNPGWMNEWPDWAERGFNQWEFSLQTPLGSTKTG